MAVFALYFEQARRNLYLKMCWVIFAVAADDRCTSFYEDGSRRLANGNFVWGSYNAIFLLMFASLALFAGATAQARIINSIAEYWALCSVYRVSRNDIDCIPTIWDCTSFPGLRTIIGLSCRVSDSVLVLYRDQANTNKRASAE